MPHDIDQKRSSERFVGISIVTCINEANVTTSRSLPSLIKGRDDHQIHFFRRIRFPDHPSYHHRWPINIIARPPSLSPSIKGRDDHQTIFFVLIDHRQSWSPDNHCHWSEDSTDYTSGENLVIVRLRLSINTDATAVANHSDGLLSSVEVDVPRFTIVILSKNILYVCFNNALHFPRAYSCSLVYFPR